MVSETLKFVFFFSPFHFFHSLGLHLAKKCYLCAVLTTKEKPAFFVNKGRITLTWVLALRKSKILI